MSQHIQNPTVIKSVGTKVKLIEEFIGFVNSQTSDISIARMKSPGGWEEPAQTPEFDEYTLVLKGTLNVWTAEKEYQVKANQAFIARKGEKIRYSTPDADGAEYVAVCLPAFSPDTVNRDE